MIEKSDAAIILACGLIKENEKYKLTIESKQRVDLGIKIYETKKTSKLIMAGGHKDLGECYGISVAEVMRNYAIQNGINKNDVLVEDFSLDTVGDLFFAKKLIIHPKGWKNIGVVTHDWHLERTKKEAEFIYGNEYNLEYETVLDGIKSEIIEKEKQSLIAFQKTFQGINQGEDKKILERLLTEHPLYNIHLEYFEKKLNQFSENKKSENEIKRFKNWGEWAKPEIKEGVLTKWNWMVQGSENLILGKYTDIGAFTYIDAKYGVEIQDYVELGSHCSIYSTSTIDQKYGKIVLKKNCKIGSHSIIMPGVTVGENSTIGAFSFVTKNIPDNVIAFGVPAKVMRKNKNNSNGT